MPPADPIPPPESLEAEWLRLLEQSQRPLDEARPTAVLATPSQLSPTVHEDIRWWRPGWEDMRRYVGWRWVFLSPALLLLLCAIPAWRWPSVFNPFVLVGAKLAVFMGAVALTLAGYVVRRAARARREPFCIFCGYNLSGLPDHYRCPECGRPYTWRIIAEYRRDPEWFIERYRALRRLPPLAAPFDAGPVRRRRRDGT